MVGSAPGHLLPLPLSYRYLRACTVFGVMATGGTGIPNSGREG